MKTLSYLRRSVVVFPLAALAALAMFVINEVSYRDATRSFDALGRRGDVRAHLNGLAKSLLDAESSERGYLLTGRDDYLGPYRDAQEGVHRSIDWLRTYQQHDPVATRLILQLVETADEKMSELATTIELRQQNANWRDMLMSDIGREKMDRVRSLTEQLLAEEAKRVQSERKSVYQTLMLNRIGVSAMAALSLLALFMYLRQSAVLDERLAEEARHIETERDRLEDEVAARTRQLKELAQHLQTIREDERNRLARELHDELGALLTAAKLDVARLKSRLGDASRETLERLAHLNETLNGGIALKRRIIEDLRPSSLSNLGLVAALEILLREFSVRSELPIENHLERVDLGAAAQLTVYRLVQEALTNIAKYAKASRVKVTLEGKGRLVRVAVEDDGIGFDPQMRRGASHGLIGMRYRVEAEGGEMRLRSAPGDGTLIEATLPAAGGGEAPPAPPGEPIVEEHEEAV